MKRSTMATLSGAAAGLAGGALASVALLGVRKLQRPEGLIHHAPDAMTFVDVAPGVSRAVVWGDPAHGAYAAFTRFAPGTRNPTHTHPHDIALVVLSGAYIYSTPETEIRVGPRSYLLVPAGVPHISSSDPREGLLMFEESTGPFAMDFVPYA